MPIWKKKEKEAPETGTITRTITTRFEIMSDDEKKKKGGFISRFKNKPQAQEAPPPPPPWEPAQYLGEDFHDHAGPSMVAETARIARELVEREEAERTEPNGSELLQYETQENLERWVQMGYQLEVRDVSPFTSTSMYLLESLWKSSNSDALRITQLRVLHS